MLNLVAVHVILPFETKAHLHTNHIDMPSFIQIVKSWLNVGYVEHKEFFVFFRGNGLIFIITI